MDFTNVWFITTIILAITLLVMAGIIDFAIKKGFLIKAKRRGKRAKIIQEESLDSG